MERAGEARPRRSSGRRAWWLGALLGVAWSWCPAEAHADSPFATPKIVLQPAKPISPSTVLTAAPKLTLTQHADDLPSLAPPPRDYDLALPNQSALHYVRAGANVLLLNYLVWQQNWISGREYIFTTRRDWDRNLKQGFEWDKDPIQTNFFGHPYHGGFYFSSARSAGLSFWEAIPYTLGGSLSWELFGETERPSVNDVFATTLGGILMGEALYRISSQVLDESLSGPPRLLRELTAAAIAPGRGLDRLLSGRAWRLDAPPQRRYFRVAGHFGLDHTGDFNFNDLSFTNDDQLTKNAVLAALDLQYGDGLPRTASSTLGPFEMFQLYIASNLTARNGFEGVQIFGDGLLYGWSSKITDDTDKETDNNVLGFFQTFDFQGVSAVNFGGMGFGPGDMMIFRRKNGSTFRVGFDLQWVPIFGVTSAFTANSGRDYNLGVGGAFGTSLVWDLGRPGRLALRSRHYLGSVVSGAEGVEYTSYARFSYEIDLVKGLLAAGVAPTALIRNNRYDGGNRFEGAVNSTQIYLIVHN